MKKSICFIGARGGSKGVKRKNVRKLGTKPLIAHSIETALDSKVFSHVIVSTEDEEIAKIAKEFGAEVPFKRPKKLATSNSSMIEVLKHGIKKLNSLGYEFDIIANRDCTVPFLRKEDIKKSINLLDKRGCDAVFAVYKQHLNPYFNMMEYNSKGYLELCKKISKSIKRRQDAPIVYQLNGLHVMNVKRFLECNTHLMPKSLPIEIPPETGLMIDTEIEFRLAEMLVKQKFFKK